MFRKQLLGGLLMASLFYFGGVTVVHGSAESEANAAALWAEEQARRDKYVNMSEEERKAYREQGRKNYDKTVEEMRRKNMASVSKEDKDRFAKIRAMSQEERAAFYEQNRKKFDEDRKKSNEAKFASMSKEERKELLDKLRSRGKAKQK